MKENKVIITTMILNFIVAIIKLISGIVFSFSTLISDSIQSFMDFLTDVISLVANKIGKRRANKNYPFGYGQVYYFANLLTGILLFLIGVFILYQFFFFKGKLEANFGIFYILMMYFSRIKMNGFKTELHNRTSTKCSNQSTNTYLSTK